MSKQINLNTKIRVLFGSFEMVGLRGTYKQVRDMLCTTKHIEALDHAVETINRENILGYGALHFGTHFQVDIESTSQRDFSIPNRIGRQPMRVLEKGEQ